MDHRDDAELDKELSRGRDPKDWFVGGDDDDKPVTKEPKVRIVCAWCKRIIAEPVDSDLDVPTSHGICPRCLEENMQAIESVQPEPADVEHGGEA